MHRLIPLLLVVVLIAVACGGSGDSREASTTLPVPRTSPSTSSLVTSTSTPPATIVPASTTTMAEATPTTAAGSATEATAEQWTVARYGRNPTVVLGARGELGSGCSPGTDELPDGIWFGWVERFGPDALAFDLACLWQYGFQPAAANDSAKIRAVDVGADTRVYVGVDPAVPYADWPTTVTPAANAPGLGDTLPFWIFVNAGAVTEIAEYPEDVRWARSATAWPGLVPGCCDGGDIAPPSPVDPWPEVGWPADGFYNAGLEGSPETWIDVGSDDLYG